MINLFHLYKIKSHFIVNNLIHICRSVKASAFS